MHKGDLPCGVQSDLIGQIAIESNAPLLHADRDFERIAKIRPLLAEWFKIE